MILCIETSGKNCSVALIDQERVLGEQNFYHEKYSHAEKLNPLIQSLLDQQGVAFHELKAIAISKGPGSYTGLRIGVAGAKGFCYALDLPLLAMETTEILAYQAKNKYPESEFYVSMIDARRMEVYTTTFSPSMDKTADTHSLILEKGAFQELRGKSVVFVGDGVKKCIDLLQDAQWILHPSQAFASGMAEVICQKFEKEEFEDLAYFDPFYLKEFVAGKPKNPFKK